MLTTENTPCVDIKSCEEITQSNTNIFMFPSAKSMYYLLRFTIQSPLKFFF